MQHPALDILNNFPIICIEPTDDFNELGNFKKLKFKQQDFALFITTFYDQLEDNSKDFLNKLFAIQKSNIENTRIHYTKLYNRLNYVLQHLDVRIYRMIRALSFMKFHNINYMVTTYGDTFNDTTNDTFDKDYIDSPHCINIINDGKKYTYYVPEDEIPEKEEVPEEVTITSLLLQYPTWGGGDVYEILMYCLYKFTSK